MTSEVCRKTSADTIDTAWPASHNGRMRWKRVLAIGAIAVVAGGVAAGATLLFTYHEATKIDRSNPEIVLIRYLDATFERKDEAMASLYTCANPADLKPIGDLLEDLKKRETDFGVSITVTNGPTEQSSDTITTPLTIEAFKDGTRNSRWTETWRFTMADEDGWRVCGAERLAQPSGSPSPPAASASASASASPTPTSP